MKKTLLAASCSFDIDLLASDKLVLIPEGIFRGIDGRPYDAPHWRLTPENGVSLAAKLNERHIDMLIDYEHGVIAAKTDGKPAPAAGWLKSGGFEYVNGIGLCSKHWTWTAKAQSYIAAEEYKYLSPFILYDESGDIYGLINVALTNTPNLDSLPPALLAAAAQDFLSQHNEDLSMNAFLKLMLAKLGLAETATEQEALTAANSAFANFDTGFGTALAGDQGLTQAIEAAIAAKVSANSQAPDPAKYVPVNVVTSLQQEIANLKGAVQTNEVETLVAAACSDGRLLGNEMKAWATDLGKSNPQALKDYLDKAPKIPALNNKQTNNSGANHQQHNQQQQHTPEALQVAALMNVDLGVQT